MKKSYLALGLVAAVAMSSCSNDENIPVNPNQPEGAEKLVPITLRMTNSVADVEVSGARTRGTGTVGSMDAADNYWQYEDIYVLMTTSDYRCLDAAKGMTKEQADSAGITWGFTSAMGDGPFLKEQFNGQFWARPEAPGDGNNTTILNYFLDQNEWWNGAPINKYYPMNGESQFFAYYIDDAATTTSTNLYDAAADPNNYQTADPHAYPVLNTADEGKSMTVDFKIDGSQDLMAGVATTTDAGQAVIASFSAKTARQTQPAIPQITMKHLLSRLTFNIIKGAESTDMVRLDTIKVLSKSKGSMTVAYHKENVPTNIIAWDSTQTVPDTFYLKEKAAYETVKTDPEGFVMDAGGTTRIKATVNFHYEEYDDSNLAHEGLLIENYGGKNYVKIDDLHAVEVKYDNSNNGAHGYRADFGRGYEWLLPNVNIDQVHYDTFMTQVVFETLPNATLNDGKNALVDFTPIVLKDVLTSVGDDIAVGEAMFVQPGVDTYEMILDLTLTIRKADDTFDGVNTDDYTSTTLTEHLALPLTIKLNKDNTTDYKFEAGKSYAINITIYGLEKVRVEAVPEVWANGGNVNIGGDNDSENGDYNPAP